jgi:uncharacterized protein (DUF2235 family)
MTGAQENKSIILFSDGTGNSSAQLFKTNVWRMYEAVDLGPRADKRPQISYYDDGVGTSSFAPLAAIGGAFGWGLKRNVLDIYRFACRNYKEGDDIYVFGFSRGAFTARLVTALIASEGLVRSENETDLMRKAVAAYRHFRRRRLPRRVQKPTKVARRLRDLLIRAWHRMRGRKPYHPEENLRPKIRFIGVWDTVAAYGGPIVEITRAVDNWFFPLSMPDYGLHENVLCARHALAIDDERDAFHPLLWDEVHEQKLIEEGKVKETRLRQVWFTGMHADVGGGYPDESLSYVSLLWMMEEAEDCGLRTLTVIKDRFRALASSSGPIHDSRSGLSSYYRYQPRRIAAWLNPVDDRTLSLRDPAIKDDHRRSRGLLRSVRVHRSVVNRIAAGTDRYAPLMLPATFEIVPPHEEEEDAPQSDSDSSQATATRGIARSMVAPETRALLLDTPSGVARLAALEPVLDLVWLRRITYFATLAATLLLLALPLMRLPTPPVLADGRMWIGNVIRMLTIVLPAFTGDLVEVYADNPFYFLSLSALIASLLALGKWLERTLRDEARRIWRLSFSGGALETRDSWVQRLVRRLRNSRGYQRSIHVLKWYVLPDVIIFPVAFLALCWGLFGASVQVALPLLENSRDLCRPSNAPTEIGRVARPFKTSDVCSESFGLVTEGKSYVVTFDVIDPWSDSTIPTNPVGASSSELSSREFPYVPGYLAVPLKRVVNANYLQPLIEIRPAESSRVKIYPLDMRQVGDSRTQFRANFKAARTGELFLFVNDAMIPLKHAVRDVDYGYFYKKSGNASRPGNWGTACVVVESEAAPDATGTLTRGTGCQ